MQARARTRFADVAGQRTAPVIEIKGLDKPPRRRDTHQVADFVEISCVASKDHAYYAELLQAVRKDVNDEDEVEANPEEDFVEGGGESPIAGSEDGERDPNSEDAPVQGDGDSESLGNEDEEPAEADDERDVEGDEVFAHLQYRAVTFGSYYPFRVGRGEIILREELSEQHRLYLFLLFASALRHFTKHQSLLTKEFELLAVPVLRAYLPGAEVHLFGTNAPAHSRYGDKNKLYDRLVHLADDLRVDLRTTEGEISSHNIGDEGLDVVAWMPFRDDAATMLMLLGQAGCGHEWSEKFHEVRPERWRRHLVFDCPYVNLLLIPHCFRQVNGRWFDRLDLEEGILFDRVRITSVLVQSPWLAPEATKLVEGVAAYAAEIL